MRKGLGGLGVVGPGWPDDAFKMGCDGVVRGMKNGCLPEVADSLKDAVRCGASG